MFERRPNRSCSTEQRGRGFLTERNNSTAQQDAHMERFSWPIAPQPGIYLKHIAKMGNKKRCNLPTWATSEQGGLCFLAADSEEMS